VTDRRSGYAHLVGPSPTCEPGDSTRAAAYLDKIERAIDRGGWNASERTRLYRLRDKWRLRAQDRDARFLVAGTRAGRLDVDQEGMIRTLNKSLQRHVAPRSRKRKPVNLEEWAALDAELGDSPHSDPRLAGGPDSVGVGPDHGEEDTSDDEVGERPDKILVTDVFRVPGQDDRGHAQRVQCRVMPVHYRALTGILNEKKFPFGTLGDAVRWCIVDGIRKLNSLRKSDKITGIIAQADSIMEILRDEQFYMDYQNTFVTMSETVNRHLANGADGEARRLVAVVRNQIEKMPEGYWRERYLEKLKQQFGHLLRGAEVSLAG
jgi:hypothetical protein